MTARPVASKESPPMRLTRLIAALLFASGLLGIAAAPARAQVEVDVNQGVLQPLPIAIPGFGGAAPGGSRKGSGFKAISATESNGR